MAFPLTPLSKTPNLALGVFFFRVFRVPIPDISHLQFLLLAALIDGQRSGYHLRAILEGEGHRKSGPAFYQLMARMEDAGLVKGRYEQKEVEGQAIRERVYEVTGTGATVCESVRHFYATLAEKRLGFSRA